MSPMCGHEHLLLGMALDGEWVREMADLYATVAIRLLEILFEQRRVAGWALGVGRPGLHGRAVHVPCHVSGAPLSGAQEAL